MTSTVDLSTVIIGYQDRTLAQADFDALRKAHASGRLPTYESALVVREGDGFAIVDTTIAPRERHTIREAVLGMALCAVFAPSVAAIAVGAAVGAIIGSGVDAWAAYAGSGLGETRRIVGDAQIALLVVTDQDHIDKISARLAVHDDRVVIPVLAADVRRLETELQQAAVYEPT